MIPTKANVRTITDMRENALKLLKEARKVYGPLFIFYRSRPQAVLLNLAEYEKLRDLAEDYLDSLEAQKFEKKDKRKERWFSLEKVAEELEKDYLYLEAGLSGRDLLTP